MGYKKKIFGTSQRPRLSVFRSNKHIYVQLIDDSKRHTLVAANSLQLETTKQKNNKTKKQMAQQVGKLLARRAKKANVEKVILGSERYKYNGRVKQLAEGVKEGGVVF